MFGGVWVVQIVWWIVGVGFGKVVYCVVVVGECLVDFGCVYFLFEVGDVVFVDVFVVGIVEYQY